MSDSMFSEFAIEEIDSVEAMSEASDWFFIGLGVAVVVGICAC